MKHLTGRLCSLALVLGSALGIVQAQTQTARDAVLVIRHAEDADAWAAAGDSQPADKKATATKPWPSAAWATVSPNWPEYFHPYALIGDSGTFVGTNTDGVKVPLHGLSGVWEVWGQYDVHKDGTKASMKKRDQYGNVVKDANGKDVKVPRTVPYLKEASDQPAEAPLGESQAVKLAEKLDAFLAANGFSPVKKAITMNPQSDPDVNESKHGAPTPNPFDTLWPYLKKHKDSGNPLDLHLVKRKGGTDMSPGIKALVTGESGAVPLVPSGSSTLICWTGEAIETRDGSPGLLQYLSERYCPGRKTSWTSDPTSRCADLVIYYKDPADGQGVIERWLFNSDTGTFTLRETKPGEKARPQVTSAPAAGA